LRVVVKLGTKLLTDSSGLLDRKNIFRIVEEIGQLLDNQIEVIVVSSGAIGAGCGKLKCNPRDLNLREKQAVASVGQTDLMNLYKEAFSGQDRIVGQLLLTSQDLSDRKSYLNIRNTLNTLLKMNIVPIINENDSVTVEEIKFGDNDHLSAIITSKVDADKLIILTDVDGFLDAKGEIVKEIKEVTEDTLKIAGGRGSEYSVGGMHSKLKAAQIVSKICGTDTFLANGRNPGILKKVIDGENPGTIFIGKECGVSHKKRWIAYGLTPSGKVVLDAGAIKAVKEKNSSLLPVGIKSIEGKFNEGDSVVCVDETGKVVARGLVNYKSADLKKIMGRKSVEIEKLLGYKYYDEIIHKDNLVLI
jgi:glutamate 5-kinase